MKPRCGIDLDGVVCNWMAAASKVLRDWYGVKVEDQWTDYDLGKDQAIAQLGPETGRLAWSSLFLQHGLERGVWDGPEYPGAFDALRRLSLSHDVVIVTKRPPIAARSTYDWLLARRFYPSGLVMLDPTGGREKSSIPCDWYVDDSPAVVEELEAAGRKVYLMDRPWNQACGLGVRVRGWDDLLTHVFRPLEVR